jgi:hypothetical protein
MPPLIFGTLLSLAVRCVAVRYLRNEGCGQLPRLGAALAAPAGWPAGGLRARCDAGLLLLRLVQAAGARPPLDPAWGPPDPGQRPPLG